jgi:hypothetical protein
MANSTIYTRVYSDGSAGKLASGRGSAGDPLTHSQLLSEFEAHKELSNRIPTALVSVSDRIIDTLNRALTKYYHDDEHPSDIWVAFIEVPNPKPESVRLHSARLLAEQCGEPNTERFSHEFLFEWAIPKEYRSHLVSLETLMGRWQGSLIMDHVRILEYSPSTTKALKNTIAELLGSVDDRCDPWEIGEVLADFATTFGARAPLNWIVYRLFVDCVSTDEFDDYLIQLKFSSDHSIIIDVVNLEQGATAILEEWSERIIFSTDHDNLKEWKDAVEGEIEWDVDMFMDTWCDMWEQFPESCDEAWNELSAKHGERRAAIEREAVRIGF